MLDTSYQGGNYTNNIKINAVSGAILKNHPKSWFERFNLKSDRAKELFTEGGHCAQEKLYKYDDRGYPKHEIVDNPEESIIVLQMVICGDMEVMAELVYAKDYEIQKEAR